MKRSRVRGGWVVPVLAGLLACGGDDPVDPGPGGGEDPVADVAATVTGPTSVPVGADATFEATATNAGPDAAAGLVLTATLPDGVTATATSGGGSQSGRTVTWDIGSLANGGTAMRSLTIVPDAAGTIRVVAAASADTDDPDASNNDGSAAGAAVETLAIVSADVVATVSQPGPALAGDEVAWTLTVGNEGPSDADNVVARLEVAGIASADLTASDGGTVDAGVVTWPVIEALADGASMEFTVTGTAPLVSPASATATATAATDDVAPGNNDGSAASAGSRVVVTFDPVRTIDGESAGDQFGWLMDVVGDVDGDGFDDVVIGAPDNDAGGTDAGRAYIYSAATGTLIHTFTGSAGQRMGFAVDGAGDVNGDGVPDAIVGGPAAAAGRVVVISGADGSVLHDLTGETNGDGFGRSVSGLGDVNGDGHEDVVASAAFRGRVYVIDGDTGATIATADGPGGGLFGSAVGEIGDLDSDGIVDFAVGNSQASGGGTVTVLSGVDATQLFAIVSPSGGANLGAFWINTPGDLNGDGLNDIFAADINSGTAGGQAGRAYVFSGADGSILVDVTGESAGDQFGIGRGIPDANGDGVGDLFVAGWQNDEGAGGAGKAYVVSGADGSILRSFANTTAGENLGFDAIGIEDVTGDAIPDYLLSGDIFPTTPGKVYIIAGRPLD